MKVVAPLAAAAAAVAVVAGTALLVGGRADDGASPTAPSPAPAAERLWTGTATFLQEPNGSLTLCGGAVLLSLPPPVAAARLSVGWMR